MIPNILTVGTAYMNMTVRAEHLPGENETVTSRNGGISYLPEGQGFFTALACARLGNATKLLCRLGADFNGQRIHALAAAGGVDTSLMIADKRNPTGVRLCMTDGVAPARTLVLPGANTLISTESLTSGYATQPNLLLLGFDLTDDLLFRAADLAEEKNIPVCLSASGARDIELEKLPPLELFVPDEAATELYTGIRPNGSDACLRAVLALSKRVKSRFYVVNLAERGCFIFDGRHFSLVAPYPAETVDATCADACFLAGLATEYLRSEDIGRAAKYANAVAAVARTRAGGIESLPTAQEVATFARESGVR